MHFLILFVLCSTPFSLCAKSAIIGFGGGHHVQDIQQIFLVDDFAKLLEQNKYVAKSQLNFNVTRLSCNATMFALGTNIKYTINYTPLVPIYFSAGLGLAYSSKKIVFARDLGTRLLFEDVIGCGLLFGRKNNFGFGYSFVHFSNAYTKTPNHGLNLHFINFLWELT